MNYPDVVPGQEVTFSAQQENDIRHLLNTMNGIGGGVPHGGNSKVSRLKVYNGTAEKFKKGVAVSLKNTFVDDAVEAVKYTDDLPHWGITTDIIDPGCFGEIVVSGPVEIAYITDGSGDAGGNFVKPDAGGEKFIRQKDSGMPLLADEKNSRYIVLLGGGQLSKPAIEYNGYFTCKVLPQTKDDINKDRLRVAVCDGETWDAEKQTSLNPSIYEVNGVAIAKECTIVTVNREKPYIVLQHVVSKLGEEKILALSKNDLLKREVYKKTYNYIIGELYKDTTVKAGIIQRHPGYPDTYRTASDGRIYIYTLSDVCMFYADEDDNG